MSASALLQAEDSALIVIDVQDNFTCKLEAAQSQSMLERIVWLIGVAHWLNIPLLTTVEDLPNAGGPSHVVAEALPPNTPIFNKMIFSLAHQPDILAEVERLQRRTLVLVGLETDVCVLQSALGLLELGCRVAVITDATGSPGTAHASGLARMQAAGVVMTDTKGIFYEWVRTVEASRRFEAECAHLPMPSGLVL